MWPLRTRPTTLPRSISGRSTWREKRSKSFATGARIFLRSDHAVAPEQFRTCPPPAGAMERAVVASGNHRGAPSASRGDSRSGPSLPPRAAARLHFSPIIGNADEPNDAKGAQFETDFA